MQEELNSKISELVDHELSVEEALSLLDSITNYPELEEKLQRYRVMGQVLKTDVFINSDAGFVNRIKSEVQHEPIYLLPKRQRNSRKLQAFSALAASVAVMAIVIYGGMSKPGEDNVPLLQIADNIPLQPQEADPGSMQTSNKKFNDYLEAHRGSLYTAGSPGYQSHVRLADYGQE